MRVDAREQPFTKNEQLTFPQWLSGNNLAKFEMSDLICSNKVRSLPIAVSRRMSKKFVS